MNAGSNFCKTHWGKITLTILLFVIVGLAIRPGKFILGNDNYSPELNPTLTLERSLQNPAWRSYRILGVPSDSEQADITRSFLFSSLEPVVPLWALSQGYVFIAFILGCLSIGFLTNTVLRLKENEQKETLFLISGVFYAMNLVAFWMMYSPLKVFLAGYAFLPFVLWRLILWIRNPHSMSAFWLLFAMLFLTTSAMVPTTFIVESGVILVVLCWELLSNRQRSKKQTILAFVGAVLMVFGTQLFWILPFISYVQTNSGALQQAYINRALTPGLIENELKFNIFVNTIRYYFSWISISNDDGTAQFVFRDWYLHNRFAQIGSFLPVVFAGIGGLWVLVKKQYKFLWLPIVYVVGCLLIVGSNPPFGFVFMFLQKTIPLFEQVFRWQSSKLYPLMVIPMAVLGGYGVVVFASWVKQRVVRFLLYSAVVVTMCVLFWPYFIGNIVGKESFQTVPTAYFSLQSYLKKNAVTERIFIAPEANTLYFRNHTWGFFGSSFLNYLIPNPLIEKALTTGSMESEGAERVIEAALYSQNQEVFIAALRRYSTPYVLLDTSATRLHNGYTYDWKIFQHMVENNASLSLVFTEDFLSLYRVLPENAQENAMYKSLYNGHNFQTLNTLFALSKTNDVYTTSTSNAGIIYPFALHFDSIATSDSSWIETTSTYTGASDVFTWNMDASTSAFPSSLQTSDDGKQLLIAPAFPELQINDSVYRLPIDATSFAIDSTNSYVSLGTDVLSMPEKGELIAVDTAYNTIANTLRVWSTEKQVVEKIQGAEDKYQLRIPEEGVVTFSLTLSSPASPRMVSLCVWVNSTYDCVNKDQSVLVGETPTHVQFVLPRVIQAGELLDIYVQPIGESGPIYTDGVVTLYTQNVPLQSVATRLGNSIEKPMVTIQTGDQITLRTPRITSWNSYHYQSSSVLQPTVPKSVCPTGAIGSVLKNNGQIPALTFLARDCAAQIGIALNRIKPPSDDAMGLLAVSGTNTSGIPVLVRMRKDEENYPMIEDRFQYKGTTTQFLPVIIPNETVSYAMELYSYGTGVRISENTLASLSFQFIPKSWYLWSLIPRTETTLSGADIQRINQAHHTGWAMTHALDCAITPVTVNGWEQGWIDQSHCGKDVQFTPSNRAYIGYALAVGVIGAFLLLWPLLKMVQKWMSSKKSVQSGR